VGRTKTQVCFACTHTGSLLAVLALAILLFHDLRAFEASQFLHIISLAVTLKSQHRPSSRTWPATGRTLTVPGATHIQRHSSLSLPTWHQFGKHLRSGAVAFWKHV
jgi:hypothetical protein